jgi:hypothetical protein
MVSAGSPSNDRHDHNLSGNGGITPLHLAAQHGHADAAYLLLNEGRWDVDTGLLASANTTTSNDVVDRNRGGATPLHRASFLGAISSMRVLLSWGTDEDGGILGCGGSPRMADILARDGSYASQGSRGRLSPRGRASPDTDRCLRLLVACDREMSSDRPRGRHSSTESIIRTTTMRGTAKTIANAIATASSHAACYDGRCRHSKVWEDTFRVALTSSIEDAASMEWR